MNPGKMHQRIVIQARTATEDTQWDDTITWADYLTRWADVNPVTARERMRNQGPSSEATYKITMRYESALTDQHRITWNGKIFDIVGIINVDERDTTLEVLVKVWDQS